MTSTLIMSALGFGFWLFVAHVYSASEIGVASSLIAISTLISNLGLIGYNAGLIRFLPMSKNRNSDINTAGITVFAATIVVGILFLLFGSSFGLSLALFSTPLQKFLFILTISFVGLNSLTDSVFISNRKAQLHTAAYAVQGVVKLLLPLFLITFGALGIYSSFIISVTVSLLFSIFLMYKYCDYKFLVRPNKTLFKRIRQYASNNYFGTVLSGLPSQIIPTIIILKLTNADAAYFSMAWTMINLIYVIPAAVSQSLLAESSHDIDMHSTHLKKTIRILLFILIPTVILAIIVAPYLLSVFGTQYSQGSTVIFQILALATFFVGFNYLGTTILNVNKKTFGITAMQLIVSIVTLSLVWPLLHYGLVGVGTAMLVGYGAGSIYLAALLIRKHRQSQRNPTNGTNTPPESVIDTFMGMYGMTTYTLGDDLGGGDRSLTALVSFSDKEYILKIWSDKKHSIDQAIVEMDFMTYLHAGGIPVPKFIRSTDNECISTINTASGIWIATLMTREQGQTPNRITNSLVESMAMLQAKIHTQGIAYASLHPYVKTTLRGPLGRSRLLFWLPHGVSHFDYYKDNVITRNGKIACVIDFGGIRYDSVIICLYFTLTGIFESTRDMSLVAAYVINYQKQRGLNLSEVLFLKVVLFLKYKRFSFLLPSYA